MNYPHGLTELRSKVDKLDNELCRLLDERGRLAIEIGRLKKDNRLRVPDYDREKQVLDNIAEVNGKNVLNEQSLRAIFREIMGACRALQQPVRVGFLGPIGTFSHIAAISHFGKHATLRPYDNLAEAFNDADAGKLEYILAPLENSTEGVVGQTLDLLSMYQLNVIEQFAVPIHHSLMARSSVLERIEKVASHHQALSQTRGWLALNLPGASLLPTASSGAAAAMAQADNTLAVVGPAELADLYHLEILAENIEDNRQNQTLFVVVGKGENQKGENDRTMMWFTAPHRSGSLYECLKPLAEHGVNLTRLHSRPSPLGSWRYLFFLEMEGHFSDESVKKAMSGLKEHTEECAFIGSYSYVSLDKQAFKK